MMNETRKKYCKEYLDARKNFRDYADKDDVLKGNDNIVGRIGEAIAHSFLEQQGRNPEVNENQTEPGFDITCENPNEQISVKLITSENKGGSTSKIRKPFNAFIGIEIDENNEIIYLGYISENDFDKGLQKLRRVPEPIFSRTMFNKVNLFNRFGDLYEKPALDKMNLI